MKQDGTYTVQEILAVCEQQLQSWERAELADALMDYPTLCEKIRCIKPYELADITGYTIYENEPDDVDLFDISTSDLVDELVERDEVEKILDELPEKDILKYVKENLM